jgi:hypothetical protein
MTPEDTQTKGIFQWIWKREIDELYCMCLPFRQKDELCLSNQGMLGRLDTTNI